MHETELDIHVERNAATFVVRLVGELDIVSAPRFQAEMRHLLTDTPEGTTVLVDAARLDFIDSVGIGELVRCWQIVNNDGHALAIINPAPFTRRILAITGLDFLIVES